MIILFLGLVFVALMFNVLVYEYRVKKTDEKLKTFDFTGEKWK